MSLVAVATSLLLFWGNPVSDPPRLGGRIRNVHTKEVFRLPDVGPLGRIDHLAWREANHRFRSWRTDERRPLHPRLLRTIAHLQRHFGGRDIELVSAYRVPEHRDRLSSYHQVGRAIDFRIPPLSNRVVFDYARTLPRVGAGYYPTSGSHVHADVRARATIWIDLSKTGEGAGYVKDPSRWLQENP
jgi:uncharacterized protein YcbK (DUF882 family)